MYDVLIVGYGPTGMMAAILLGRAGHRVAVLERYKTLYNLPRVGIVHDDVLRMFHEIGCSEQIKPATHFLPRYELSNKGRILLSNKVAPLDTHGWPEMTSIYQPAFEAQLDVLARAEPTVEVLAGQTVVGLFQDADKVEVTIEDGTGVRRQVQGRYLIGSDGGNSFVREAIGVTYENLGFDQEWLVIDARAKKPPRPDLPLLRQFCEPEQPGMTMQMGPHHRRWSFMIFHGESADDAVRPENVWRRLNRPEGGTPDEFELVRVAAYKFRSLMAERWRVGRVLLAGDAAHQMPPFLAQGMCSGFRDAHNAAWKLDMVLRRKAPDDFLDTYVSEREPNSRATIVESMRVGLNVNERDPEKVRLRDEQLMRMQEELDRFPDKKQLIAFRVPGFKGGFIARPRASDIRAAGDVFPQARISWQGKDGLFDDVAGYGFAILARNGDAAAALSGSDRDFWTSLGGRILPMGGTGPEVVQDLDGRYAQLMDECGCDVIVKRSDYYIFGGCRSVGGLPGLMQDMRDQLKNGGPKP